MYHKRISITGLLCFFDERRFCDSFFCLFETSSNLVEHKLFPLFFIGVEECNFDILLSQTTEGHSLLFSTVILIPLTSVFSLDTLVEDIPHPDESLRDSFLLGNLLFAICTISNELKDKSLDDTENECGD